MCSSDGLWIFHERPTWISSLSTHHSPLITSLGLISGICWNIGIWQRYSSLARNLILQSVYLLLPDYDSFVATQNPLTSFLFNLILFKFIHCITACTFFYVARTLETHNQINVSKIIFCNHKCKVKFQEHIIHLSFIPKFIRHTTCNGRADWRFSYAGWLLSTVWVRVLSQLIFSCAISLLIMMKIHI